MPNCHKFGQSQKMSCDQTWEYFDLWVCLLQNVYNYLASSYKLVYILVTKGQNVHKFGHSTCSL